MKDVTIITPEEKEIIIKNTDCAMAIVIQRLSYLERNIEKDDMGISEIKSADFYREMQNLKMVLSEIGNVFE